MKKSIDFLQMKTIPGFRDGEQYDRDTALLYAEELRAQGWTIAVLAMCASDNKHPQKLLHSELGNEVKSRFGYGTIIGPIVLSIPLPIDEQGNTVEVDMLYHGAALWQKK